MATVAAEDVLTMAFTEEKYIYRPLEHDEIRLLEIEPAVHLKDAIVYQLHHFPAGDCPKYTALSYVWGRISEDGSHLKEHAQCDGKILRITRSLSRALRRIRENSMSSTVPTSSESSATQHIAYRYLWVDAICINQSNLEERLEQVRMMARTYTKFVTTHMAGRTRAGSKSKSI